MLQLLSSPVVNGKEIIDKLSQDQQIADLFAASAGVWEGYSIREHTEYVFRNFSEQYGPYNKRYDFENYQGLRLWPLLKLVTALHDIGKPIAIQNGDKSSQHSYTVEILKNELLKTGFSQNEIQLAVAMVDHDTLGILLKGRMSLDKAFEILKLKAQSSGLGLNKFFPLQAFYFCIDAAAYPSLRQRIFHIKNGLLAPVHSEYEELHKTILKTDI